MHAPAVIEKVFGDAAIEHVGDQKVERLPFFFCAFQIDYPLTFSPFAEEREEVLHLRVLFPRHMAAGDDDVQEIPLVAVHLSLPLDDFAIETVQLEGHRIVYICHYQRCHPRGKLFEIFGRHLTSVEDPVGLPPITGAQRIREFYKFVIDGKARVTAGIIRTSAEPYMAAMPLEVEANSAGVVALVPQAGKLNAASGRLLIRSIDVMTFNDAGLIVQMRAFWGAENIEPA